LWRSELAGYPRDAAAWRGLYDYANSALPRPGSGLADLHVIVAQAVMGDDTGLKARARQMTLESMAWDWKDVGSGELAMVGIQTPPHDLLQLSPAFDDEYALPKLYRAAVAQIRQRARRDRLISTFTEWDPPCGMRCRTEPPERGRLDARRVQS
jgi:hypothetical protein